MSGTASGIIVAPAKVGRSGYRPDNAALGVAIVGCGLIGQRRARVARAHPGTRLLAAVDTDIRRAQQIAHGGGAERCDAVSDWRSVVSRPDIDAIVVSTSNGSLAEITLAALALGRHVLMEKPMGRNLEEANRIAAAAGSRVVLQVGFNHRRHPGIRRAAELIRSGAIGRPVNVRARYGHGGRPGLEREWRSNRVEAGGGELLDQGVHIADLLHWMIGMPARAYGVTQTAVWEIAPLEDNAFGVLTWSDGMMAQLHVSMTQWKNLFSFEVHGTEGAVLVEGLGGSYGIERMAHVRRSPGGGVPAVAELRFDDDDDSWSAEWAEFMAAIAEARAPEPGAADGLAAMRIIDALYRSAASGAPVDV